jgi:hypothetical protein
MNIGSWGLTCGRFTTSFVGAEVAVVIVVTPFVELGEAIAMASILASGGAGVKRFGHRVQT